MYEIKMAFALIQVGTNLWVNPLQVTAVYVDTRYDTVSVCVTSDTLCRTTDWNLKQVKAALSSKAVAKAMESK